MSKDRKSIYSTRLSLQLLAVTLILALLLSLTSSYLVKIVEIDRLTKDLRAQSEETLEAVSGNFSSAVIAQNVSDLELLSKYMLDGSEDMCRVLIEHEDGSILVDNIKPKIGSRGDILSISKPIIVKEKAIGKISVFWDLDRRLEIIEENAKSVTMYSFIAFSMAILLFLGTANWLILIPLRKLETQFKSVVGGGEYRKIQLPAYNALELHHLNYAVDDLQDHIISQKGKEKKLKQAKTTLEAVRLQLVQAIEAVTEGFVYYDADDKLTICNQKYREIYSKSADLLYVGNSFENIIRTGAERGQYKEAVGRIDDWVAERLERHQNPQGPLEQELPNNRWVRIIETRSKGGGLVGIRLDITEFKKIQQELHEAKDQAEHANETKSEFLAMISHEIRTPLNGVLGILNFLNESDLNHEQQNLVQTGQESATNLLTIINDILDFSKLEAGKIELELAPFDPVFAFLSVIELLKPTAFAKGIYLEFDHSEVQEIFLVGDASRLRQILLNLVGNAIKFTKTGGVTVSISISKQSDNKNQLRCEVLDTGIGLEADKQNLLFGKFVTIDTSYTRKYGGTGLGLAISQQFIEIMEGEIGFESEFGKGSVFWFEVSLEKCDGSKIPPTSKEINAQNLNFKVSPRVLLVEDNAANQMVARKILGRMGCIVDVAGNGIEAVDAVSHFPYDVVLMDISMPEMDGISATRKIRQMEGMSSKTPIIALTAHALKEERDEFLSAGMNDYLQKPAAPQNIYKMIDKWVNGTVTDQSDKENIKENTPLLDHKILQVLEEETGSDVITDLMECFLDDTEKRKLEIESAILERDSPILSKQAHSLGSSAVAFGGVALHQLCRNVETLLKEKDEDAAFILAKEFSVTIEATLKLLVTYKDELHPEG